VGVALGEGGGQKSTDNTTGKVGVGKQGGVKAGGKGRGKTMVKSRDSSASLTADSDDDNTSKGTLCVSIVCQLFVNCLSMCKLCC